MGVSRSTRASIPDLGRPPLGKPFVREEGTIPKAKRCLLPIMNQYTDIMQISAVEKAQNLRSVLECDY